MGKGMSVKAPSSMGNGGIMGSGIFGMFGTVVQCKADDTSMYCSLAKILNVIIMVFIIFFVLYIIYKAFAYFTGKKTTGGLGPVPSIIGGWIARKSKSKSNSKM
jgi:hypothetical protein